MRGETSRWLAGLKRLPDTDPGLIDQVLAVALYTGPLTIENTLSVCISRSSTLMKYEAFFEIGPLTVPLYW